jgi:hypothetical protein
MGVEVERRERIGARTELPGQVYRQCLNASVPAEDVRPIHPHYATYVDSDILKYRKRQLGIGDIQYALMQRSGRPVKLTNRCDTVMGALDLVDKVSSRTFCRRGWVC